MPEEMDALARRSPASCPPTMTVSTKPSRSFPPAWISHPLFLWPLLLFAFLGAGWTGMKVLWRRDLERQRARFAAIGDANPAYELFPPLPPERDATDAVRRLLAAVQARPATEFSRAIAQQHETMSKLALDPRQWPDTTREWLAGESADELESLAADAARGDGARLLHLEQGLLARDDWRVIPMLSIVRCLSARALLLADTGEVEHAARLVERLLALDRMLVEQPTLARALACAVLDRDALCALRSIVGSKALDESRLRELAAALDARDPLRERLAAFDLECAHVALEGIALVRSGNARGFSGPLGRIYGSALGAPLCDEEEALYLGVMLDMRDEFVATPWSPPTAGGGDALPRWSRLARCLVPASGILQRELVPYRRALDLARAAVALARAQRQEARWPARLDDLAPRWLAEVPGDVPGGKPFAYSSSGSECEVALDAHAMPETAWAWPMNWKLAR